MSFGKLIPLLILAAVTAVFAADGSLPEQIDKMFGLTGTSATIIGLIFGTGIASTMFMLIAGKNKIIMHVRNLVIAGKALYDYFLSRIKRIMNDTDKTMINNFLNALIAFLSDFKWFSKEVIDVQKMKLFIDEIPEASTGGPMIPVEAVGIGYAPAAQPPAKPVTEPLTVEPKDPAASNNITTGILLLGLLLFGASQAQAKEFFNGPFDYLSLTLPGPGVSSDSGHWYIKPIVSQSLVSISKDADGFVAQLFSGTGVGVSWERTIIVKGQLYSSFSVSASGLFTPVITGQPGIRFAGDFILSTLNNWLGCGVIFDGKHVYGALVSTVNIL